MSTAKISGKGTKSTSSAGSLKKSGSSKTSTISSKPQLPTLPEPIVESNASTTKLPFSKDYYHDVELKGIFPMFLTSQSQAIAKSTIDVDVTAEKMFKMVPKQDLINDMANRLAISDFTPAKAHILQYPRDEMILHYDPEYRYTQNFFLVIDVATADLILNPPESSTADTADSLLSKVKKERGWMSLGSEKEVEQEWVSNLNVPARIQISRKYQYFNSPYTFGDRTANEGICIDIKSFKDYNFDLYKLESQIGVQAVPLTAESTTQTKWNRSVNFAVQYEPLEMTVVQKEEILGSSPLKEFVLNVSPMFEEFLQQNELVDIFANEYDALGEDDTIFEQSAQTVLQEYQSFTDLLNSKDKCVSCINWHPAQRGVVAMSCTLAYSFDERISHSSISKSKKAVILIWNFNDPFHPQLLLEAPADVGCFEFNPENPSIVAAGCVNGQIVLWDISEYHQKLSSARKNDNKDNDVRNEKEVVSIVMFSVVSSIEFGHRAPVTDIHWLPKHFEIGHQGDIIDNAENGDKQLVSSSLDGTVSFWDLRYKKDWKALDLMWKPFLRVPITTMDSSSEYSVTKFSILTRLEDVKPKPVGAETGLDGEGRKAKSVGKLWTSKFYCGTEEGDIVYLDWMSKKEKPVADEKRSINLIVAPSRVEFALSRHFGPVCDLVRSPFFPEILLSTGGWSFHIWKDKAKEGPLLSSPQMSANVTCGTWSPSRPGVFYIGRSDGVLEVWDLLDKSHSATTIQNVATTAIASISIQHYPGKIPQQFIAAGDDSGTLHILETPRNLLKILKNEKQIMSTFYERESKRLYASTERKLAHAKGKAAFDTKLVEKNVTNAKLAQAKLLEAGAKPGERLEESHEDLAAISQEKAYLEVEKKFLDQFLAPAAELV